ncbi:hypothetical protein ACQVQT_24890 [Bacillus paranthracis]|uniref:Uncharacterized protein n=3 Tax=root TaxID=1 RepID=A0A7D8DDC5_9BACI|nr:MULTISPECIES: hypothetical protein [Bacillus]YP_009830047.1 hypothetical protein HWA88_gp08 [Bacillus phage vB_BceS-MY192]ACJ81297.1 hypothetical protein BCAH187_A2213 [Bacillus cereus AH187]EDZ57985.1 hypothetical protein BCH308197_2078 [Bacillus cereus H3081.97]EEL01006.1 hypothetical protein bcere0013_19520 [Bacillus cereus BDRD-ST26]EJP88745.1 phage protein [Bacillus cereus IS075]EJR14514.1 hypothetical protein II7_02174 [Bacillus cereus MSX-A12]EOO84023.1 phage protein [Bacillus cere
MRLTEYQVLLPNKFWNLAESKDELKQMIEQYFNVGYPHYEIQRIIKSGQAYVAVCTRR